MNTNQLKGKLNQVQGDSKIWLGKTTHNQKMEIEGNLDKASGKLLEQKGDALAQYEKAKKAFENKTEEVQKEMQLEWDKLTHHDVKKIDQDFEKFADKLKEKYNKTQEDVNAQIREFMGKF
ncbi:CsbD family protein [Lutibacter holmesii]|uniref:CsbD family protein n=1 Tax=Lutibacter holmesii TaxID=1137985 RepID=A0ABW3WJ78_9FLAO